mgnify:FL=1
MNLNFNPQKRSNSRRLPTRSQDREQRQVNTNGWVRHLPTLVIAAAVVITVSIVTSNADTASSPVSSPTPTSTCPLSDFLPHGAASIGMARDLWFSNETDATETYGHISTWNTTFIPNMENLFKAKSAFNEDLGCWDTGSVDDMDLMFKLASAFNQDIGGWDTAKVKSFSGMFDQATAFNQDISGWDNSSVVGHSNMVDNSGMSCSNFKALRCAWSVTAHSLAATVDKNPGNCPENSDPC